MNLKYMINKVKFETVKHSPTILLVGGVVSVVASGVMIAKASFNAKPIFDDMKEEVEYIQYEVSESEEEELTDEQKKELKKIYVTNWTTIAKLYAPAVGVGVVGVSAIMASHGVIRSRNVGLTAAYATLDKGFKSYRTKVVEKYGEKVDYEFKNNVEYTTVEKTTVNSKGKEKTTTKQYPVRGEASAYSVYLDKNSIAWIDDPDLMLAFLRGKEQYANDLLEIDANQVVFLNDILKMLELPKTKEGQVVGWRLDRNKVHQISFGVNTDGINDNGEIDDFIRLDFNVEGNVWDNMGK